MEHANASAHTDCRLRLVQLVVEEGTTLEAAAASNVAKSTVHRWVSRWWAASEVQRETLSCLGGRSSRPHHSLGMRSEADHDVFAWLRVALPWRCCTWTSSSSRASFDPATPDRRSVSNLRRETQRPRLGVRPLDRRRPRPSVLHRVALRPTRRHRHHVHRARTRVLCRPRHPGQAADDRQPPLLQRQPIAARAPRHPPNRARSRLA